MRAWLRENVWHNPLLLYEWRLLSRRMWWRSPLMLVVIHITVAAVMWITALRMGGAHGGQWALLGVWLALPQLLFWAQPLTRAAKREQHWEQWDMMRLTLITRTQKSVAFMWSHLFVGWLLTSVGLVLFNLFSGQTLVCVFFLPVPSHVVDLFPATPAWRLGIIAPIACGLRLVTLAMGRRYLIQLGREYESTTFYLLATLWFPFLFVSAGAWVYVCRRFDISGEIDCLTIPIYAEVILIMFFDYAQRASVKRTDEALRYR